MQDRVRQNRRNAIWAIPLGMALLAANAYLVLAEIAPDIRGLLDRAPAVRVTPLSPLAITALAFPLVMVAAVIANAIPCSKTVLKKVEYALMGVLAINVLSIAVSFLVVAPLQHYAMPRMGYERCNILQGHPSMYFTDWVSNPAWCVRGKSREWVNEQALLARAATTPAATASEGGRDAH